MKDTKSLTLLLLSSVLFLLSIILLCTWGYQYYHQIQEDKSKLQQTVPSTQPAVADDTRDSLLKIYRQTLSTLDSRADTAYSIADSINGQLNINMQEFYRLRDEIALLLQAQKPNADDLVLAKKKIAQLQQKVEQLRYRNTDVESENKRLRALIDQLSKAKNDVPESNPPATETAAQETNVKTIASGAMNINAAAGTIAAMNLNLNAFTGEESNETLTSQATSTGKLVGSFTVKNNSGNNSLCDLVVVVTDPSGRVIQKSAWESGTFETSKGKRIYTVKIRCETGKGESKQISFSVSPDTYPRGNYTMLIYHEGKVIGRTIKALS